jgi:hypothetical protein
MIVRLWVLAWAARYLKYVPILGWRFSETIGQTIEDRMDRDVDIEDVTVEYEGDSRPTDARVEVTISNELPVDLTVAAVNLRLGYAEASETVANVLWAEETQGSPPANVSRSMVESDSSETLRVERRIADDSEFDTFHVDGTLTTKGWLDLPSTRRLPLGTLPRELPATEVDLPA